MIAIIVVTLAKEVTYQVLSIKKQSGTVTSQEFITRKKRNNL
jgi:hypothetical protein